MNIFANTVVTLSFELYEQDGSKDGVLLESTPEPIAYIHGGHSGMLPKIEAALNHRKVGETVSILVEPADAFGEYAADLVKIEPISALPDGARVGMQFEARAADGEDAEAMVYTVTDIADGKAVLDGNHPWAGKRLRFECRVLDVRPATAEEIEHGHVHGDGGHHH